MRRNESARAPTSSPALARATAQLSAAGEAVEVLALTADHDLLTTLRNSVNAEQRRIWHAPGFQEAAELIMAGRVGVAIIDTATTGADTGPLCERFRNQFPDLVLIVTGTGEDQSRLVSQITSGDIYRFLHKPLSEARAHQFIETSVRRHLDGRTLTLNDGGPTFRLPLKPVLGGVAAVLIAIIAAIFIFSGDETAAPIEQQAVTNDRVAAPTDYTKDYSSRELSTSTSTASPANNTGTKTSSGNASPTAASLNARGNTNVTSSANADTARSATQSAAPSTESSSTAKAERRETTETTSPPAVAAQTTPLATPPPAVAAATEPPANSAASTAAASTADAATPPESAPVVVTIEKPVAPTPQPATPAAPAVDARTAFLANIVPATSLPRTRQIEPTYPYRARRDGTNGWVELDFTVDEKGSVKDISVRDGSPKGVFDKSASDALAQWRFKPVLRDGRAVEQRSRVRLRFELEN